MKIEGFGRCPICKRVPFVKLRVSGSTSEFGTDIYTRVCCTNCNLQLERKMAINTYRSDTGTWATVQAESIEELRNDWNSLGSKEEPDELETGSDR